MRGYLIRLTAVSILAAVLRRLAPENGAGKATRLGAGLLIILTAVSPLRDVDLVAAAEHLTQFGYGDILTTQPVDKASNELLQQLIIESSETYILDKAEAMGAEIEVNVETSLQEGYPIPWRVTISGDVTNAQRDALTTCIEGQLGIPAERQEW